MFIPAPTSTKHVLKVGLFQGPWLGNRPNFLWTWTYSKATVPLEMSLFTYFPLKISLYTLSIAA